MNKELRIKELEIRWLVGEKYKGVRTTSAERDIKRLAAGEHIAYVIGYVEFLGVHIDLSFRPLIPRPETEYWAGRVIEELSQKGKLRCLDVFAGSGCIGVSLLKHLTDVSVDFADIESKCVSQIKRNLTLNEIQEGRGRVIQSDMLMAVSGTYDCIVANPPYCVRERIKPEVLSQEPRVALLGGGDGMKYIRRLIRDAPRYLNPGGMLYLEFDSNQKNSIEDFVKISQFVSKEFFRDQYGRWRWARLVTSS